MNFRVGNILALVANLGIIMIMSSLPSGKGSLTTFYLSRPKTSSWKQYEDRTGWATYWCFCLSISKNYDQTEHPIKEERIWFKTGNKRQMKFIANGKDTQCLFVIPGKDAVILFP